MPCAGLNYLSRSLQTASGNARLAMAGYNGGIGVISRGEWSWSAETNRYVRFGARSIKMQAAAQRPAPRWMNGMENMVPGCAARQAIA